MFFAMTNPVSCLFQCLGILFFSLHFFPLIWSSCPLSVGLGFTLFSHSFLFFYCDLVNSILVIHYRLTHFSLLLCLQWSLTLTYLSFYHLGVNFESPSSIVIWNCFQPKIMPLISSFDNVYCFLFFSFPSLPLPLSLIPCTCLFFFTLLSLRSLFSCSLSVKIGKQFRNAKLQSFFILQFSILTQFSILSVKFFLDAKICFFNL